MRRTNFKGKSLNTGEWIYGGYYNRDDCLKGRKRHIIVSKNNDCGQQTEHEPIDPKTLCEFTGLQDNVNNKDIYEADIIKALNRNYDNNDNKEEYFQLFLVIYMNGCWMFGPWNAHEFFNKFMYIEDVGNSYDKLDLSKEIIS